MWLCKIDKIPEFIGTPYKIRACDPRFRNARDWVYEWHSFTSFCYFTTWIRKWLKDSLTYPSKLGTRLERNRDKLISWLCEIDKNVVFIGAPYRIRTCDPRFRNARDWVDDWSRFTSFCYFTIVILQHVYENGLKTYFLILRN